MEINGETKIGEGADYLEKFHQWFLDLTYFKIL
jgi:hypothetical protein